MEKGNRLPARKLDKESKLDISQILDSDIILGNPKYNCRYHGICEIKPSNTFGHYSEHPSLSLAKARIYLNLNDDLEILFKKKTISSRTQQLHFSDLFFIVSESIDIPLFVSDFLNSNYTIWAGKYFIISEESHYKVTFKR